VQARIDKEFTPVLYEAPHAPEQPAALRFVALAGAEKGPRIIDLLVDLVTLDFVTWHYTVPGFLRVIIRLHGNLLMGRAGRVYVGWLGLAMLALGISGLILWWPGRKRWRAAFLVKRGARGLRLYRDLHNAIGIWTFVVLMTVSFSGVYLVFPQTVGAGIKRLLPSRDNDSPAPIVRDEGAQRIDADRAIAIALSTIPRAAYLDRAPRAARAALSGLFGPPGSRTRRARGGCPDKFFRHVDRTHRSATLRPSPDRSRLSTRFISGRVSAGSGASSSACPASCRQSSLSPVSQCGSSRDVARRPTVPSLAG
jgi:uncharacterized iron-regulated membrane protein